MSKNLKDYNTTLVSITVFNLVVLNGDMLIGWIRNFNSISEGFLEENFIILFIIPIVTYILTGLLPSKFKANIVYMRLNNPLPGTRVFTKLIHHDERIDITKFNAKYSGFSTKPEDQNKLWYQIYSCHKYEPGIFEAHRDFLKSRDMTSIAFIILTLFIIYTLAVNLNNINLAKLTYLVFQYILLAIVSQNKGNRFTLSVIAEDLNKSKGEV